MESALAQEVGKQVGEQAAKGFFERLFEVYNRFVSMVPAQYQWIVSLIIILAVASFLFNLIRKNIIWLILLVVLFPGFLPILKNFFDSLTVLVTGKPLN